MAPATDRPAILVSHGSPSRPAPQETAIARLAARTSAHLPGWTVRGATLAMPGALDAALAGLENPLIYPIFAAPGWFTDTCLPRRIGARQVRQLPPLGQNPELVLLACAELTNTLTARGMTARETTLLIVAHGSPSHPESRSAVQIFANAVAGQIAPARLRLGFIEEPPFVHHAARDLGPAICLPFFSIAAGHVTGDLPESLAAAGFSGPVLPPLMDYCGLPAHLATTLRRATMRMVAA